MLARGKSSKGSRGVFQNLKAGKQANLSKGLELRNGSSSGPKEYFSSTTFLCFLLRIYFSLQTDYPVTQTACWKVVLPQLHHSKEQSRLSLISRTSFWVMYPPLVQSTVTLKLGGEGLCTYTNMATCRFRDLHLGNTSPRKGKLLTHMLGSLPKICSF